MRAAQTLLFYASLWVVACTPPPEEASVGRWHVSGGQIRDLLGRAVVMRGVNLSGEHKQKPYLSFHRQQDFNRIRTTWGMNAVRFLISWSAVEPDRGAYDTSYLEQVAQRMDWAEQAGLLVVLDLHQDVYGEGFGGNGAPRWTCNEEHYERFEPTSPWFANYASPEVMACFDRLWTDEGIQGSYAEAWRKIALHLGGRRAIIGFDVINEPHWGSHGVASFERQRLAPFYEKVVLAVRSAAPQWIAFLEPAASRNLGIPTGLTSFPFEDVAYAPHSYDAGAEQGSGFDPSRRAAILKNIAALAEEARALQAALWIGEYGGVAADPGITEYMDAQYDGAGAVAASTIYWQHGKDTGYGLLNPDGTEKEALLEVLVRPYPRRIAGDPLSYSFDERTGVFELTLRADPTVSAPTEIAVPRRVYPSGYSVTCRGQTRPCRTEALDQAVRVDHQDQIAAGQTISIAITPK